LSSFDTNNSRNILFKIKIERIVILLKNYRPWPNTDYERLALIIIK